MNLPMPPSTTPTPNTLPVLSAAPVTRRSAFVAAALGWLLPGLGQLYMGRPGKAFLMLVAIGGLFYLGLYLTDFTCVNPKTYSLEFAAHAFLGGPTAVAYYQTRDIVVTQPLPLFEVGRLYAAVAGLLNVVAICDALGEVLAHNQRVRVQMDLRRRFLGDRQRELERMASARERAEAEAIEIASAAPISLESESPPAEAVERPDETQPDPLQPDAVPREPDPEGGPA